MKQASFFVAILFVILCVGTNLPSLYAQDNPNTITFDNKSGEPALVKLIGPTGQTVAVPNGQSRTVNIGAGKYYILMRYGSKPDQYSYSKGDPFTVTQTATQYSAITITLHKVIGGDYPTHPTSQEEFDKAAPPATVLTKSNGSTKQKAIMDEAEKQDRQGEWNVSVAFGKLTLTVDPAGETVSKITGFEVDCGGVKFKMGSVTVKSNTTGKQGWSILDDGRFEIKLDLYGSVLEGVVIKGAFSAAGLNGRWKVIAGDKVCSDKWKATR